MGKKNLKYSAPLPQPDMRAGFPEKYPLLSSHGQGLIEVIAAVALIGMIVGIILVAIPRIQSAIVKSEKHRIAINVGTQFTDYAKSNPNIVPPTPTANMRMIDGSAVPSMNPCTMGAYDQNTAVAVTMAGTTFTRYTCIAQVQNNNGALVEVDPTQAATGLLRIVSQVRYLVNNSPQQVRVETLFSRSAAIPLVGSIPITVCRADPANGLCVASTDSRASSVVGSVISLYVPGLPPYTGTITQAPPNNIITLYVPKGTYTMRVLNPGFYPYQEFPVTVNTGNNPAPSPNPVILRAFDDYSYKAAGEVFVSSEPVIITKVVSESRRPMGCPCCHASGCAEDPTELIELHNPTPYSIQFSQITITYYDTNGLRATLNSAGITPSGSLSSLPAGAITCYSSPTGQSQNITGNCGALTIPAGGYFLIEGVPGTEPTPNPVPEWQQKYNVYPDIAYNSNTYDLIVSSAAGVRVTVRPLNGYPSNTTSNAIGWKDANVSHTLVTNAYEGTPMPTGMGPHPDVCNQ